MNYYFSGIIAVFFSILSINPTFEKEEFSDQKPNVLFILVDDMNGFSILKNYPVLKTPAIDKLISQSYSFKNATCPAPVCNPSRAAMFSGKYPHNTGVYFNKVNPYTKSVLATLELLPENFKRNGYTTWGRGKSFSSRCGSKKGTGHV